MDYKSYELVAWTKDGSVRMIPSLVEELARPDVKRIEARLEDSHFGLDDEISWLIDRSRDYESLGFFYERVGHYEEAFQAYAKSASLCTWCSDDLWLDGTYSGFPVLPLLYRFLGMHNRTLRLARQHPLLMEEYRKSDLKRTYDYITLDDRLDAEELDEALEIRRAWRFGR